MSELPRIAFLGLGRMGAPMAINLIRAGYDVTVWNRTTQRARDFAAANDCTAVDEAREVLPAADIVITMVADGASLREIYDGNTGLLSGWRSGQVAIDMSTSGPETITWLSRALSQVGGNLLDAPVSGSTEAANKGLLTAMVGGAEEVFQQAKASLEAMCARVYYLGPSGSGIAMKLAVNSIVMALGQAVSEALVLAESAGISRDLAYTVFENSAIAAPFVKYRHDAFCHPDETPAAFALLLAAKDLRLIDQLAKELTVPMPQAAVNLAVIDSAIESGFGEDDMAAIAIYLRNQVKNV